MLVYVINQHGKPLMPCKPAKARKLLKQGKAKVIGREPFTIQLCYGSSGYKQEVTAGIDAGYETIGVSAVTEKQELFSAEVDLLKGMSERIGERAMYRRNRRNRLRYRKPRFDNRKKEKGWFAPSIQHKFDSHLKVVAFVRAILPVSRVIVEVANFDIQQIKNPEIEGKQYQQGEQYGFENVREYVLHRDNHTCQNPECMNKSKHPVLVVHHIQFRSEGGSDKPSNLITLCTKCHTPENHRGFLKGWKPKLKSFKPETFMSTVRWKIVNALGCQHTYGYVTKAKRIEYEIDKSHANDAFVIAGGKDQARLETVYFEQNRRNNRSLEKFYDAAYIDGRDGRKKKGCELNNGRTRRNKNLNTENFHQYRERKVTKGRRSIRKKRYVYQPKDLVLYQNQKYSVKGVQNLGAYVKLAGMSKPVKTSLVAPYQSRKGFCVKHGL